MTMIDGIEALENCAACETCKHWKSPVDDLHWADNLACPDDWGKCLLIEHGFWREAQPNDKAFTIDGSDYHSQLDTRYDFGCVLHERQT